MSIIVAVPIYRMSCKVEIDKGRSWSVIEELLLWDVRSEPATLAALAERSGLPRQVVVAAIARLMRFRLVEVVPGGGALAFRASAYGASTVTGGYSLPFFPKRVSRRASFVIERATGDYFPSREVRILSGHRLEAERKAGRQVRIVSIEGNRGPSMSHEANINRLSEVAARGWDEQIALVDSRTASLREDEYMVVRVVDGVPRGLPESSGATLRKLVDEAAALPIGTLRMEVEYGGPPEEAPPEPGAYKCTFDPKDLVVGGSAQRGALLSLLTEARRRFIVHSTFLDAARFSDLLEPIRDACRRGVTFDLLWGADEDEGGERRNHTAATEIARLVREDKDLRGRFKVHMRSTGSHAKLLLCDTADGSWVAAMGSCNWLSSPFQAVELTAVLRDQRAVADVADALQQLAGRRGVLDDIATEMHVTARDLRRLPIGGGPATVSVLLGAAHDRAIREASGSAATRFVVGSNRLGSTARPGAIMQGGVAAGRAGVSATVMYAYPSGPLKNRHAKALAEEAAANGVRLLKTKIPLHGKFVAWDEDDIVVTSLNWASASCDPDFPWGEIGVRVNAKGISADVLDRLAKIYPQLVGGAEEG